LADGVRDGHEGGKVGDEMRVGERGEVLGVGAEASGIRMRSSRSHAEKRTHDGEGRTAELGPICMPTSS
jgi:hypothetical protein